MAFIVTASLPMSALPLQDLLLPLSPSEPSGPDLSYDPAFSALEALALGRPERQTGEVLVAAEPPVWSEVYEAALALAQRSRDLRVAVLLTRAGVHLHGVGALADGLSLMAGWLTQMWDTVHPQLDASDHNDPTMRLNALEPLCSPSAGLADWRAAAVLGSGHPLTVRLIELAWTSAETWPGESRPDRLAVTRALQEATAQHPEWLEPLAQAHEASCRISEVLIQRVGTAGPELQPLLHITQALADAAGAAAAPANAVPGGAATSEHTEVAFTARGVADVAPPSGAHLGVIASREDALRSLGAVCDWIERNEPSNPAPLLIRRAQRLMAMSFMDLVRDLAPEGLAQLERIAGLSGAAES